MKKIKYLVNHKDSRGVIKDLIQKKDINAITYLTIKKGKIRGNHLHKKTTQWNFILSGKVQIITKKKFSRVRKKIFSKYDLIVTVPNEMHAFKAISDSEMLVFTQGPRGGKEYETDTYRLSKPLIT